MTEIQFNEIKERLADWRSERGLTYENQREEFLGNVFEKVSEYFRAKDDLERVEALCDIAVFCFNAFDIIDFDYYCEFCSDNENIEIYNLTDEISEVCCKVIKKLYVKTSIPRIISYCQYLCKNLGFNFYKCMLEKIKEIESRTGFYDESLNKFIKDEEYYSVTHLKNEIKLPKIYEIINVIEEKDLFLVKIKTPNTILNNKFKKWYKADYESCRL
ncbi:hypothetical protein LOS1_00080 [Campylobacter phage vB_CjeM_Los1]|uniref:Uncharacterized protein n=1 Tax=Campylobacter phage vB_CjeM_Los1 TaxID=1904491 RepID=A0A1D8EXE5_9CAUD|nr:hypothetical protein FDH13_gp080 [Campylobacter phage vB_CjeM_Los1]AOT25901.1 hypothetical protein LOS1_00080 [Campylobacter phage vB_CjeM_Los1]